MYHCSFQRVLYRTEVETVIHADNDFATVAFLRIKNATLESKEETDIDDVQVPSLLEDEFLGVRDAVLRSQESLITTDEILDLSSVLEPESLQSSSRRLESWVAVSNICLEVKETENNITIEDEVIECFHKLQGNIHFGSSVKSNSF